jgi:hypothetical protein
MRKKAEDYDIAARHLNIPQNLPETRLQHQMA